MIDAVEPVATSAGGSAVFGLAELVEAAAAFATHNDGQAMLAPQVATALTSSGFARHFVPRRHGGAGGGYLDLLHAVLPVSAACASTGWLASLIASVGRIAACLPNAGQEALWAEGPDTVLAASLVPLGRTRPVAGGHLVTGTWAFVSGIELARWVLLVGTVDAGSATRETRLFAVPVGQVKVLPTWQALGMRATASHSVLVEEVFVPHELSVDRAVLESTVRDGRALAANRSVTGLFFAGPMLGAGRGCLESWSAGSGARCAPTAGSAPKPNG